MSSARALITQPPLIVFFPLIIDRLLYVFHDLFIRPSVIYWRGRGGNLSSPVALNVSVDFYMYAHYGMFCCNVYCSPLMAPAQRSMKIIKMLSGCGPVGDDDLWYHRGIISPF